MKEKAKIFLFCPQLFGKLSSPNQVSLELIKSLETLSLTLGFILNNCCSQSVIPRLASSAGNLSEMQIIRPHPRPTEAETLGVEPSIIILIGPPGVSELPKLWEPLTISFFLLLCFSFLTSQAPSLPCLTLYLIYEFSSYLPVWWPVLGSLSCLWPWNILDDIILYKYRMK